MTEEQTKKLRLLLTGLACGDSLGSTSEFTPQQQVPAVYAQHRRTGWPFAQAGGGPFGWPKGAPTDDTDMAMCLVRSFLEKGRFDPADVAERFVGWMRSGPRDIGGTTRRTLGRIASGSPWHEGALADYRSNPDNAANGSLMRNGVVPALADTLEEAFAVTLHHGMTTHYSPLPQACCAAQTYLLWELLAGRWPFEGAWTSECRDRWTAWLDSAGDEATKAWRAECGPAIAGAWRTLEGAEWDPDRFNPFGMSFGGKAGYCLLTLQIAVWAVQWSRTDEPFAVPRGYPAEPFERGGTGVLGWVALVGNDSDTYGATAGPLVAAAHGGLPAGMIANLSAVAEFNRLLARGT